MEGSSRFNGGGLHFYLRVRPMGGTGFDEEEFKIS